MNNEQKDNEITVEENAPVAQAPINKGREIAKKLLNRWFIDAFTGMAQGLFVTLIAGTILATIGAWVNKIGDGNVIGYWLINISKCAKTLMGAGIGVGIANKLKVKSPLLLFAAAVAGFIGAFAVSNTGAFSIFDGKFSIALGAPGNPIGAYVVTLVCVEIVSLYAGKTKLDIILVPLGLMIISMLAIFVAWPFVKLVDLIRMGIELAASASAVAPYLVGILVSVVMGVLLTMPTSSAAIWITIVPPTAPSYILLLMGGAAVSGCAAHMVGFAVASFRENGFSGLISQGIGTSMLQIPNIMKKPIIMLPAVISSIVVAPIAVAFGLLCDGTGGGMGTSGFVGIIQTITFSLQGGLEGWKIGVGIALCLVIIPALVSLITSELMRKIGWIKPGDMKLDA